MDISQVILVIIIILGLALAAGAVIFVSGGWIKMARAPREDVQQDGLDIENDEDQPPPAEAWKPTTWYSDVNNGTLFPNQPSPSFRLSADTSFHRAIALQSHAEPNEQSEQGDGASSEATGEVGDQPTLPMPRVARAQSTQSPAVTDPSSDAALVIDVPIPVEDSAPAGDIPDAVAMAPTRPTLPPLTEFPAMQHPAQLTTTKQTIPTPLLEDSEGEDALSNAETVPEIPTIAAAASLAREVTGANESEEPAIEDDNQPTFTALPTVPMTVVPVKDDLPPTLKQRALRHAIATQPLPGDGEAVEETELLADQETAETVAIPPIPPMPSAPATSDPFPGNEPAPATFLPTDASSPMESAPVPLDDPEEEIGEFDTADWPVVILGQLAGTSDVAVPETAESTDTLARSEAEFTPEDTPEDTVGGDFTSSDDSTKAQDWPSFASLSLDDSISQPVHETVDETGAAQERAEEEALSSPLVLPAGSIESTETSENTTVPGDTDEQGQERLMVAAYSEVIRLRYDTDLDAVMVSFIGCPVKETIDVAWVFQAIGKQMQELFPPGTGGRHAMLFDIAGLELAPETEAVWQMVLDAFVTHSCPEVAPNVVLAVQYDSLERALTEDETPGTEMDPENHQRPLQITHSFGDAIQMLQRLRSLSRN